MKPSLSTQITTGYASIMRFVTDYFNLPVSSISIYCSDYKIRCQYIDRLNNYHDLLNTLSISPNQTYNILFYLESNRILLRVNNVSTSNTITNESYEPTGFLSTTDLHEYNIFNIGMESAAPSKVTVSNIKLCGMLVTPAPTVAPTNPPTNAPNNAPTTVPSQCIIQGINWCTGTNTPMISSPKLSSIIGATAGFHNDCWQNNPLANAGLIIGGRVELSYDSTKKQYQLKSPGCGGGSMHLCAFSIPANVFGKLTNVQWLRDTQVVGPSSGAPSDSPLYGSASCYWDIVSVGNNIMFRVPSDASIVNLRGSLLGTDLVNMGPWNDSSGKPYYAILTTRTSPSDETYFTISV